MNCKSNRSTSFKLPRFSYGRESADCIADQESVLDDYGHSGDKMTAVFLGIERTYFCHFIMMLFFPTGVILDLPETYLDMS